MNLRFPSRVTINYSLYYFFSISVYAWILGLLPLYFREIGFSAFQISSIAATATFAVVISSPAALWMAHHILSARICFFSASAAALTFSILLPALSSYPAILICWFFCMLMKRSSDAIVDAQAVGAINISFELVRAWGSLGFILLGLVMGALYDAYGLPIVMPVGVAVFLLTLVSGLPIYGDFSSVPKNRERADRLTPGSDGCFRRNFSVLIFTCILCWASHSALYSFMSIYLKTIGWSGSSISLAWNLGVVTEIFMFVFFRRLSSAFSLSALFQFALFVAGVRWVLLALSAHPVVIMVAQALHGITFGCAYVSSLRYVRASAPWHLADRAQGVLMGFGHSLGALLGYFVAGFAGSLLESYAEVDTLFLLSAAMAFLGFVLSLFLADAKEESDKAF